MSDSKIQFLINNLHENLEVEVKNWLNGLQSNDEKATLAKEIIALANHGGGYIFIGFEDEGDGHPWNAPAEVVHQLG
jgi:predicted HTH transcriptional regulator